jgi:signal transduction histidine kinase
MLTSCPPLPRSSLFRRHRCLHAAETNVHRLANACSVDVEIMCIKKKAFLVVPDDGKGIHRSVLQRLRAGLADRIGLTGLRERLTRSAELRKWNPRRWVAISAHNQLEQATSSPAYGPD